MNLPDLFHCRPLASVLSRQACGARYDRQIGRTCATCTVGRQHARGALPTEWEDRTPIEAAAITPATMASLRIHLAVIEAHVPAPMRGRRFGGITIREHAERAGLHPQVIRQRIVRGEDPETALEPRRRGVGPHPARQIRYGRETLTLRALARKLGRGVSTVHRWVSTGMSVEQMIARRA